MLLSSEIDKSMTAILRRFSARNSNFVTGARIAVLLCTETTQKIYRGGAEVDFFSRSRYYNKNYGYPIVAPVTKVTFFRNVG